VQATVIELALQQESRTCCMAMTMLCMADGWHASAHEVLQATFATMPDHDWLLVTLPCNEGMPQAMQQFECVRPRVTSTFANCLFLLHREALSQLQARSFASATPRRVRILC